MAAVITSLFQTLIARVANGESPASSLIPTVAKLGNGHYASLILTDPLSSDTSLESPFVALAGVTLSRDRVGSRLTVIVNKLPDGTPRTITECGLFNSSGEALLLDSFRPISILASGSVGLTLTYNIFGEL